jgi:16S rRNA (guanine966-N2)-methyltransferase
VDLVESAERPAVVAQRNADLVNKVLGWTAARVHRMKVETYLDRAAEDLSWDLVFLDPPYPLEEAPLLDILASLVPHLADGAVVVLERSARSPEPVWPAGLERFAEKKYGETRLWYLEPA